jgi:hypothetical protein
MSKEENIDPQEQENIDPQEQENIDPQEQENIDPQENHDITSDIMKIFEDTEYAYPLEDVMGELKKLGYSNIGTIVTCAIQDELIYVDSIEDDGTVYIALVDQDEEE